MKKGFLTTHKIAKKRKRKRRYEKLRNLFRYQSKQAKQVILPPKEKPRTSFFRRLWYNISGFLEKLIKWAVKKKFYIKQKE